MQTCLIENQLQQLTSFIDSKSDLTSFLLTLKYLISNLLDHPNEENYNIISKESQTFPSKLLESEGLKDLLVLLGYTEESEGFVYIASDENMIKLRHCIKAIESQSPRQSEVSSIEEISDHNKSQFVHLGTRYITSPVSLCDLGRETKSMARGSLKGLFLSKHMQKDQTDSMSMKKVSNRSSSDFTFNNNGYFHQSCNNRESKRNNCFIKDLFHKQDREVKAWGSPSLNARLI